MWIFFFYPLLVISLQYLEINRTSAVYARSTSHLYCKAIITEPCTFLPINPTHWEDWSGLGAIEPTVSTPASAFQHPYCGCRGSGTDVVLNAEGSMHIRWTQPGPSWSDHLCSFQRLDGDILGQVPQQAEGGWVKRSAFPMQAAAESPIRKLPAALVRSAGSLAVTRTSPRFTLSHARNAAFRGPCVTAGGGERCPRCWNRPEPAAPSSSLRMGGRCPSTNGASAASEALGGFSRPSAQLMNPAGSACLHSCSDAKSIGISSRMSRDVCWGLPPEHILSSSPVEIRRNPTAFGRCHSLHSLKNT